MAERRKAFIGNIVFEGSRICPEWTYACDQPEIDMLWAPSNHVRKAIETGFRQYLEKYTVKVNVVPHGYDPKLFNTLIHNIS